MSPWVTKTTRELFSVPLKKLSSMKREKESESPLSKLRTRLLPQTSA
jgi:hypothetical protein